MSTITQLTINNDGSESKTIINDNFANLNNGKIETSVVTTKGDLIVGSGASTTDRFGVGALNQVLTADPSQALGLKWVDTQTQLTAPQLTYVANQTLLGKQTVTFVVAPTGGDYTDLQSAIDALPAGGGKIFVKAGTYDIGTAGIRIAQSNTIIEGEGRSTKFVFSSGTLTTGFAAATAAVQLTYCQFKNFRIEQLIGAGSSVGFDSTKFAISSFEDLQIVGVNGGILANSLYTLYNIYKNITISCYASGSYGFKFDNIANENTVLRSRIITDPGLSTGVIVNAQSIGLYEVAVETDAAIGIDVQATGADCLISGAYLEGNDINLKIAAGTEATTVISSKIIDAITYNIQNLGGRGLSIENCRIGNGNYEQHTIHESLAGWPRYRWIAPFHGGESVASTSQTATNAVVYLTEFNVPESVFVDGVSIINGATVSGNLRVGIYGPLISEETCFNSPLVVESASTAQSGTSAPQLISLTKTVLLAGRYYLALVHDNSTATHIRHGNTLQVAGVVQSFTMGGYGSLTTPCPSVSGAVSAFAARIRVASLTTMV